MTAIQSRKRVAELHTRGTRPAGTIIIDAPLSAPAARRWLSAAEICLQDSAPKWLVTSESNGINDCYVGIVDDCTYALCFWIYNSLTNYFIIYFLYH